MHEHHHGGGIGWWLGVVSAVALLGVVANSLWRRPKPDSGEESQVSEEREVLEFEVRGMRCHGCVDSVTRALAAAHGVAEVDVELDRGRARVVGSGLVGPELLEAITSLGFEAEALVSPADC